MYFTSVNFELTSNNILQKRRPYLSKNSSNVHATICSLYKKMLQEWQLYNVNETFIWGAYHLLLTFHINDGIAQW